MRDFAGTPSGLTTRPHTPMVALASWAHDPNIATFMKHFLCICWQCYMSKQSTVDLRCEHAISYTFKALWSQIVNMSTTLHFQRIQPHCEHGDNATLSKKSATLWTCRQCYTFQVCDVSWQYHNLTSVSCNSTTVTRFESTNFTKDRNDCFNMF